MPIGGVDAASNESTVGACRRWPKIPTPTIRPVGPLASRRRRDRGPDRPRPDLSGYTSDEPAALCHFLDQAMGSPLMLRFPGIVRTLLPDFPPCKDLAAPAHAWKPFREVHSRPDPLLTNRSSLHSHRHRRIPSLTAYHFRVHTRPVAARPKSKRLSIHILCASMLWKSRIRSRSGRA